MKQGTPGYILFIDSGMGGLSILDYFLQMHNDVNIIYYADTANFPYGTKTSEQIAGYLQKIYDGLKREYSIPLIVLACNTASVTALTRLREMVDVPVVGTVPPVKPAASITKNGKIGIIATETTVQNDYIDMLIKEFAHDKEISIQASSALVEASERRLSGDDLDRVLESELSCFKDIGIDTLVFGCTHYFFLYDQIVRFFNDAVNVVDSRDGVARRTASLMDISTRSSTPDSILFISSSDQDTVTLYEKFNRDTGMFKSILTGDYSCQSE
jgi:glutamate racemase